MKTARLLLLLVLALSAAMSAWAGVQIELSAQAEVGGDYIQLRDVARLRGDLQQILQAGNVFLGPAPEAGVQREVNREDIRQRLAQLGLASGCEFTGSDAVAVRRAGDGALSANTATRAAETIMPELGGNEMLAKAPSDHRPVAAAKLVTATPAPMAKTQDEMEAERKNKQAFTTLLAQALTTRAKAQYQRDDLEVNVTVVNAGTLPNGIEGLAVSSMANGFETANQRVQTVVFDGNRKSLGQVEATIRMEFTAELPHAARNLPRGALVRDGDVVLRRAAFDPAKPVAAVKLDALNHHTVTRSVQAMTVLTADMVEAAPHVRKGALVEVDTRGPGFRIYEQARAISDGRMGDLVKVQPVADNGKKEYLARVTGFNTVEVAR